MGFTMTNKLERAFATAECDGYNDPGDFYDPIGCAHWLWRHGPTSDAWDNKPHRLLYDALKLYVDATFMAAIVQFFEQLRAWTQQQELQRRLDIAQTWEKKTVLFQPMDAALYLESHGWVRIENLRNFWDYGLDGDRSGQWVRLPTSSHYADYTQRLYEFVTKLASYESRLPS